MTFFLSYCVNGCVSECICEGVCVDVGSFSVFVWRTASSLL